MPWTKEKRSKYARVRRHKMREQGLCLSCGSPTDGKAYCNICSIKRSNQQSKAAESRKNQGICIQCGCLVGNHKVRCRLCLGLMKVYKKKRHNYVIKHKLCYQCGNETNGKKACDACLEKGRDREKKRRELANREGLCCQCRKVDQLKHASLCRLCYMKQKSRNHLNDSSRWKELLRILESQDWKCPYSGECLVLGLNDSLDHRLPRTRFPERSTDISNVEWTTRCVNQMKADRIPSEFLAIVKQIHKHRIL